jgi:GR25 family glycosyltransferase involved in LPS biosynthesis
LTVAWDILYLGTCYEQYFPPEQFEDKEDEYFVDVPSDKENLYADMYDWVEELVANYFNESTPRRVVVKAKNPVCTHGYALTQHGARKLLLELNEWMPFPVDITMIHYISEGRFKAYSVLPPMLVQWRNTKDPRKNSDIEGGGISLARNWGFVYSARKHLVDWYLTPSPATPVDYCD